MPMPGGRMMGGSGGPPPEPSLDVTYAGTAARSSWAWPWQLSCRTTLVSLPSQVTELACRPLMIHTVLIGPWTGLAAALATVAEGERISPGLSPWVRAMVALHAGSGTGAWPAA